MINVKEQIEWLEDWIQDDPEGLGKNLDTRTFNALEVAMIMQIYTDEKLPIHDVVGQSEQLKAFLIWLDKYYEMGDTADILVSDYLKSL